MDFGEAAAATRISARTVSVGICVDPCESIFTDTGKVADTRLNGNLPGRVRVNPRAFTPGRGPKRGRGTAGNCGYADRMGADTSSSTTPSVAADHPGVAELFAVLAYGEISAFYRLADEAQLSPTLHGRVALAKMAGAEMAHFERLEHALSDRGADVYVAMDPFVRALDAYHASTTPSTWLESLVKAYVGDGIAADFYREIAGALEPSVAEIVRDVLAETGHSEFVVEEVRAAVAAGRQNRDRLMLWGRRLLGEAITQAQHVMAQRDELTDLVITATGDLNNVAALFDRMQESHSERMAVLGLV